MKIRWKHPLPFAHCCGILYDGTGAAEYQADHLPFPTRAFRALSDTLPFGMTSRYQVDATQAEPETPRGHGER